VLGADIREELMLFLKSTNFSWCLSTILFNLIWFPLWIGGLYYTDIILTGNLLYRALSYSHYLIIGWNVASLYWALKEWDNLENQFYWTCAMITVGIFAWHLFFIQGAY